MEPRRTKELINEEIVLRPVGNRLCFGFSPEICQLLQLILLDGYFVKLVKYSLLQDGRFVKLIRYLYLQHV